MDDAKRKRLQEAGYTVGDAKEFLGLTDHEERVIDFRVRVAHAIRDARAEAGWTQRQLAEAIGTTQQRIAKVEDAGPGVSLDVILAALMAMGGEVEIAMPGKRKRAAAR